MFPFHPFRALDISVPPLVTRIIMVTRMHCSGMDTQRALITHDCGPLFRDGVILIKLYQFDIIIFIHSILELWKVKDEVHHRLG